MKNKDIIDFFDTWKKDPRLHTDILSTGCVERTRILCEELMKKNERCGFVYLPQIEESDEIVSCQAKLKNSQNHTFHWMRHVAPLVFDEQGKLLVLDVCLMKGPEYLRKWLSHIQVKGQPASLQTAYLNSSDFLFVLEQRFKNKNPWHALESLSQGYKKFAIIPNQIESTWRSEKEGALPLSKLLTLKRGRS